VPAALLDVDGTLVDANYHHALAWFRAFRAEGIVVPTWRLHRHVGMGGDMLVAAVAGDEVEQRRGDRLREAWEREFDELIGEVEPLDGARDLIEELRRRGHRVVLASSAIQAHLDTFLDKLGVRELLDASTTKDDVEATKPEPDLVEAALAKAETREAVMVGDAPWDVKAAAKAGVETLCVLTGGYARQELEEAGAAAVYESLIDLRADLDQTPLR
jgi:HAD superfamily hydrolase (TIGR01549 family)